MAKKKRKQILTMIGMIEFVAKEEAKEKKRRGTQSEKLSK